VLRKTATTIAILSLTAGVAAGHAGSNETITESQANERIAALDPAEVHQAIQEGEPFDLPTVDGSVTVEATERTQETIRYVDGSTDRTVERPPHVWETTVVGGEGHGLVLAFDHTVHAWTTADGNATYVEPVESLPGTQTDRTYRVLEKDGQPQPADSLVSPASHIQVYKDVYAYVDAEYESQYGSCCWADQVDYILGLLNNYFDDVQLEYSYCGGEVDYEFDSYNMDDAWNRLVDKPYNGCSVKSHWSFKDFDGCEVGKATLPGSIMLNQQTEDACNGLGRPDTDAERAYLTAHELGKNNDAYPEDHWSYTTWTLHEHRSIMDPDLAGHYHECWSQANLDAMTNWLGTSVSEDSCEDQN
jgi:hypothetical protein